MRGGRGRGRGEGGGSRGKEIVRREEVKGGRGRRREQDLKEGEREGGCT